MASVFDAPIVVETKKARERTGRLIAVSVSNGRFQVVNVDKMRGGNSHIEALSKQLNLDDTISFLKAL